MNNFIEAGYLDNLTEWKQDASKDYSNSYAFARYLADQYDNKGSFLANIISSEFTGTECYDDALQKSAGTGFEKAFADWAVANVVDADGRMSKLGYKSFRLHDKSEGLTGIPKSGQNVEGPLGEVGARSFKAYYYKADHGSLTWTQDDANVKAGLFHGNSDGTWHATWNFTGEKTVEIYGYGWVIVYNKSDSTTGSGGTVTFTGSGAGLTFAEPIMRQKPSGPVGVCGTPMLP
jgi:hypothetical protein